MTPAPAPPVSPRRSLKGWLFSVWLVKNKGFVKGFLALLAAYLTVVFAPVEPPELKAVLVGGVGLVSKLGFDVLDYWLSEVPQP